MGNPLLIIKKKLDRRSEMLNRQRKAINLQKELESLYKQPISNTQRRMIHEIRIEFKQKEAELLGKVRELGEEYMQKEIDILKDEKLRFQI